jgi:hypothetical protein
MLDLRRTEKSIKESLDLLCAGAISKKIIGKPAFTNISGVNHLVSKFKWINKIAPNDNATLAAELHEQLMKAKKYLKRQKAFDIEFGKYIISNNPDFVFIMYVEILLLTEMALISFTKPDMPKGAADLFWTHFNFTNLLLDALIMPTEALNSETGVVMPTAFQLRAMVDKHIENRKRGGIKTAEKYKPLKDWCITRAYEIHKKHPSKSKEQIVMQLLVEMRDKKWDADVMQLTETNARHTIKNKWLPRGKPATWSDLP